MRVILASNYVSLSQCAFPDASGAIFLKSDKKRFSFTEEYLQLKQCQTGIILIFQANPYGSKQTTKPAISASGVSAEFTWQGGEGMAEGRGESGEGRGRSSLGFQVEL